MLTTCTTYGVLGVGALASAIVTGVCDGVEDPPGVVLSPRNAATAGLAARFPSVTIAADNQAVVDGSQTVVVCLRRADADLLGDLVWRPTTSWSAPSPGSRWHG